MLGRSEPRSEQAEASYAVSAAAPAPTAAAKSTTGNDPG